MRVLSANSIGTQFVVSKSEFSLLQNQLLGLALQDHARLQDAPANSVLEVRVRAKVAASRINQTQGALDTSCVHPRSSGNIGVGPVRQRSSCYRREL